MDVVQVRQLEKCKNIASVPQFIKVKSYCVSHIHLFLMHFTIVGM